MARSDTVFAGTIRQLTRGEFYKTNAHQFYIACQFSPSGPKSLYISHGTKLPLVSFSGDIVVCHHSKTTGIETISAIYDQEAKSIGKAIANNIIKDLDKMTKEHGVVPDLPDYFYGPYESTPHFPFENSNELLRYFSGHGLLMKNSTVWTYQKDKVTIDDMIALRETLKKQGWKGGSG